MKSMPTLEFSSLIAGLFKIKCKYFRTWNMYTGCDPIHIWARTPMFALIKSIDCLFSNMITLIILIKIITIIMESAEAIKRLCKILYLNKTIDSIRSIGERISVNVDYANCIAFYNCNIFDVCYLWDYERL